MFLSKLGQHTQSKEKNFFFQTANGTKVCLQYFVIIWKIENHIFSNLMGNKKKLFNEILMKIHLSFKIYLL